MGVEKRWSNIIIITMQPSNTSNQQQQTRRYPEAWNIGNCVESVCGPSSFNRLALVRVSRTSSTGSSSTSTTTWSNSSTSTWTNTSSSTTTWSSTTTSSTSSSNQSVPTWMTDFQKAISKP